MKKHAITNQRQLRLQFWHYHRDLPRCKQLSTGEYPTDTRCAWVDFVDAMARDGTISEALANRATL